MALGLISIMEKKKGNHKLEQWGKRMSKKPFQSTGNILIIDDDRYCLFFLTEILKLEAAKITAIESDNLAYGIAEEKDFDTIMINLEPKNKNDLAPVRFLKEINDQVPIIVVSNRSDVDFAMDVLRAGAFDYLTRPFNNLARVETAIQNAFIKRNNVRQAADLAETELMTYGLLSKNEKFKGISKIINQIAPLDINVLITGESGTGKELIARATHAQSSRKSGSFIAVNCGALPEGLIESLLFGHKKGAFTGAVASQAGYVEKAHRGTLFLDEVGELNPKTQVALLRFIQEHTFMRVGGDRQITSDARIIASTNRNLEDDVAQKRFREDLYYRLNVIHLKVPPLRERHDDILYLADHFAKRFCLKNNLSIRKILPEAANLLEQYNWPGNVRELENFMEGLMATLPVKTHNITARDILNYSEKIRAPRLQKNHIELSELSNQTYKQAMLQMEMIYLNSLLDKHQGNVAKAARAAGIHPITLHRKLRKFRNE